MLDCIAFGSREINVMLKNMSDKNIHRACLISPLVAPLLYAFGALIIMTISSNTERMFGGLLFILSFGLPISYLFTLLFGFPVYIFLKKKHLLSIKYLTVSGALLGAIMFLLIVSSFSSMLSKKEIFQMLFIGSIMGASVSYTFGKIANITNN